MTNLNCEYEKAWLEANMIGVKLGFNELDWNIASISKNSEMSDVFNKLVENYCEFDLALDLETESFEAFSDYCQQLS